MKKLLNLVIVVAMVVSMTASALAADGTWNTGSPNPGSWDDSNNWQSSQMADGATYTASFGIYTDPVGDKTVTLDTSRTIGNLTFGTSIIDSWNLAGSGILTLDNGGINPSVITVNDFGGGGAATISAAITAWAGPITKSGTGTLVLSGDNTACLQSIKISEGTLSVSADVNLGSPTAGPIFDGGTLQITGIMLTSFNSRPVIFNDTKTVVLDIADAGNNFTVSEQLDQGTGGLTKLGAGTLTLSGANTYTGTTTVSGGGFISTGSATFKGGAVNSTTRGAGYAGGEFSVTTSGIITIGTITTSGGADTGSGGYNAGNVTLSGAAGSTSGAITAIGSSAIPGEAGGSGGAVHLTDVTSGAISTNGGYGLRDGGSGNEVHLSNSNTGATPGNINAYGGGGDVSSSGSGGSVTLELVSTSGAIFTYGGRTDGTGGGGGMVTLRGGSTSGAISAYGGEGWNGPGTGGIVTIEDSTSGAISVYGGRALNPGSTGGSSGTVHLTNSDTDGGNIDAYGGSGIDYGGIGNEVHLYNSNTGATPGIINTSGGNGWQAGVGGSVTLESGSISGAITAIGGIDTSAWNDGAGGTGGVVTLSGGSTAGTISTSGGSGTTTGGSGNTVSLTGSTSGAITANGGTGDNGGGGGTGGNGGTVTLSNSDTDGGDINTVGGLGGGTGGTGGTVTLTGSTSGAIWAYGGTSNTVIGGTGGTVSLTNSTVSGAIWAYGGEGGVADVGDGATGGAITLNGGTVSGAILAYGGAGDTGGAGGNVTINGGTNTVTGDINVSGGTGLITNGAAGKLILAGGSLNFLSLTGGGDVNFTNGTLQYKSTGVTQDLSAQIKDSTSAIKIDTNGNNVAFASAITAADGNTGGLTKSGTGTLTLGAANTYTGGTTLNQGTLTVGAGGTLGATTGALAVNNNNTTLAGTAAILNLATGVDTTTGSLSGAISTPSSGTNTATINNGGGGRNFTVNQTTGGTYAGVIAGAGSFTLGSLSTNTLTLSGTNTYTGATTISAGTLVLDATGGANRINSGNALTLSGGTLRFDNMGAANGQTFGTTALTGATTNVLTRDSDYTPGNILVNMGTMSGNGALDVTNLASTATWITSGNASASLLLGGVVTANSGTYLVGTDGSGNLITAASATFANNAIVGSASATNVRFESGGDVGFGPTLTDYVGMHTAGTTSWNSALNAYTSGITTLDITNGVTNPTNILRLSSGTLTNAAGGDLVVGSSVANEGSLTAGNGDNADGTLSINDNKTVTVNVAVVNNGTGVVGLTKTNTGTTTLAGANTYTGTTTLGGGTLNAGHATALGSAGDITFSGGTLQYSAASAGTNWATRFQHSTSAIALDTAGQNVTLAGAIDDTNVGGLTKSGAGTLTLTNSNYYTGTTTVSAGTLALGTDSSIVGGGGVTVNGATAILNMGDISNTFGTVIVAGGGSITGSSGTMLATTGTFDMQSGTVSVDLGDNGGGATLTKTTVGTVTLSGINTYTGATTITAGTLQLDGSTASGSTVGVGTAGTLTGTGTVNGNATLTGSGEIHKSSGTIGGTLGVTGGSWNGAGDVTGLVTSSSNTFTIGNGANLTANGDLAITGGSITAGNSSSKITGSVNYTSATNSTFNGVIAGADKTLTLNNAAATLTLGGINTYTGATTVSAGKLLLDRGASSTHDYLATSGISIASGATFEVNQTGAGNARLSDVSNTITGAGTFSKTGTGETILGNDQEDRITTFNQSAGGLINVQAGALNYFKTAATNRGSLTIASGASVILDNDGLQGADSYFDALNGGGNLTYGSNPTARTITLGANGGGGSFSGVISNGGDGNVVSLVKTGAGTQTLSGINTYTGATTISSGILQAGAITALSAGSATTVGAAGTLDLNNYANTINLLSGDAGSSVLLGGATLTTGSTGDTTFAGVISEAGSLIKQGGGIFTLSGTNTYSSGTTISAGTIAVSNSSALGAGDVINDATLDIGVTYLAIGGAYSQVNSKLKLIANSASDYGTITSTGAGTVTGGTIDITVNDYIANGATLDVITSNGLTYTAETVVTPYNNLRCTFTASKFGANTLRLTASRSTNGFASDAANANEANVGRVLDSITNPTADMTTVLNAMDLLTPSQTASALNSMEPDTNGAAIQVTQATLDQLTEAVLGHQSSLRGGSGVATGSDSLKGLDVWSQSFGSYLHQDPRQLSQGYNANIWGTALGFDLPVFNDIRAGACFGFAQDYVRGKDNSNRNNINSYQWTIYGEYTKDAFYLDLSGAFAFNTYDASRQVNAGPSIQRTASADYNGQQYAAYVEAGYVLNFKDFGFTKVTVSKIGTQKPSFSLTELNVTPLVSFQYQHLAIDKYTESGAGALNLNVKRQNYDLAQTGFGIKLDYPLNTKYGQLVPELRFKWLYDWVGDAQQNGSTFTGGGAAFATNGFTPAQSTWDFGTKLTMYTKKNWTLAANYDFELKEQFYGHYGYVNAKYSF